MTLVETDDGAQVAISSVGSGPPVLVCHGGPYTTHTYLEEDLQALALSHQLVFWDYRGSGDSPPAPEPSYTFERLADDAVAVMASLGHDTFDILAHSLGGLVALSCALRHPRQVGRLVLIDTAPSGNPRRMGWPTLRALGVSRLAVVMMRALRYAALWSWRPDSDERTLARFSIMATMQEGAPQFQSAVREREVLVNNPNAAHLERRAATFDVVDRLPELHQPTLVVYGSLDAPFVAGARFLLDGLPNATELRLLGCGHHPLVEAHDLVIERVESFLRR